MLVSFHMKAQQNLVPNGSFEEYNWCPDFANGFYISASKYWSAPTLGSPDYFNSCSVEYDSSLNRFLFKVPENYSGYQFARTGNAYAGISYTQIENPDIAPIDETYSEYIQIELVRPLEKGKTYNLSYFISNAFDNICGNTIGALFSSTEKNEPFDHNLTDIPNFQSDLTQFFCDSTKWFPQSFDFMANGTEKYLIIGVFTLLHDSQTSDYHGNIISGPGLYGANEYLYIDDVSIIEIEFQIPNVITPNGDGINDLFVIPFITSEYNLTILNRWGEKVFETSNPNQEYWDGSNNGAINSDGVYFYILETKENRFTGFIQLVR